MSSADLNFMQFLNLNKIIIFRRPYVINISSYGDNSCAHITASAMLSILCIAGKFEVVKALALPENKGS